jgi:hypothetical protein
MKNEIIRRQQLGLAISGPFSRNRRRSEITANPHLLITAGVIIAAILFVAAIFTA